VLDYIARHRKQIAQAERYPDVRRRSVVELAERCNYWPEHATQVGRIAVALFDQTRGIHGLTDRERDWVEYAALLHDIGVHISYERHHKHSYYLIKNGDLRGFDPEEIEAIALIARYHRQATPKKHHDGFGSFGRRHRRAIRTLAAILRLADQGKLSVDDPLSKYVPDFPRAAEVKLRHLLSHTSGIASYTNPKYAAKARDAARRDFTLPQLIQFIATLEPLYEFEPGTAWFYSNSGYILLGQIIEKVSGKSYRDFLQAEFFGPLGLAHTAVDQMGEVLPDRAHGYTPSKGSPSGFVNPMFMSLTVAGPAGAIRSTARDMLEWQLALFGGRVLSPRSLTLMSTPTVLNDGRPTSKGRMPPIWGSPTAEYGFGLFIDRLDGRRTIGHGGAIPGFNTWMETFPDDGLSIVLLSNTDYPAAEELGPKVVKALLRAPVP